MVLLLLPSSGLMTFEAIHAPLRVHTRFVFVNYRISCSGMALRAFTCGFDQLSAWLFGLAFRPFAIEKKGCQNQCEGNHYRQKHRPKGHPFSLPKKLVRRHTPTSG